MTTFCFGVHIVSQSMQKVKVLCSLFCQTSLFRGICSVPFEPRKGLFWDARTSAEWAFFPRNNKNRSESIPRNFFWTEFWWQHYKQQYELERNPESLNCSHRIWGMWCNILKFIKILPIVCMCHCLVLPPPPSLSLSLPPPSISQSFGYISFH